MPRGRVAFAGFHPPEALGRFQCGADLFVWPAINEAYGMALLEAQAMGLAVVAGDTGGVSEIVTHNKTGLLAPVGDVGAFADAIRHLLARPDLIVTMGQAAAAKVASRHSLRRASDVLGGLVSALAEKQDDAGSDRVST